MRIKAVIIGFLFVGVIVAAVGPVFAAPPIPPHTPAEVTLPDVYDLAPEQAEKGLDIADSYVPDAVPP